MTDLRNAGSVLHMDNDRGAPDLLSIGETAQLMGVSVATVRRYDAAGKISSVRTLGGQRRFRRADVLRVSAHAIEDKVAS